MNKKFFSNSDTSIQDADRCAEVELLRKYLQDNLPDDALRFKMFLDMHAHATKGSIFIHAPIDKDE